MARRACRHRSLGLQGAWSSQDLCDVPQLDALGMMWLNLPPAQVSMYRKFILIFKQKWQALVQNHLFSEALQAVTNHRRHVRASNAFVFSCYCEF